jgi:P-loop containing NTP hydrolase pore-1
MYLSQYFAHYASQSLLTITFQHDVLQCHTVHQQDNWHQGRKKAVWLSVSSDLKEDAARDFADIRAKIPCFSLSDYGYTKITEKSGCIFVTYRRVTYT